jgi:apolipoprotein D and lipocalin family protein
MLFYPLVTASDKGFFMYTRINRYLPVWVLVLLLAGCTGKPDGVIPMEDFDLDRYLGNWYEIARLDHSFERGLTDISAHYSLRDDGGVRVLNRGFSAK